MFLLYRLHKPLRASGPGAGDAPPLDISQPRPGIGRSSAILALIRPVKRSGNRAVAPPPKDPDKRLLGYRVPGDQRRRRRSPQARRLAGANWAEARTQGSRATRMKTSRAALVHLAQPKAGLPKSGCRVSTKNPAKSTESKRTSLARQRNPLQSTSPRGTGFTAAASSVPFCSLRHGSLPRRRRPRTYRRPAWSFRTSASPNSDRCATCPWC